MADLDYAIGMAEGLAGRPPDPARTANGGANSCNDYERGYIDSGNPERVAAWHVKERALLAIPTPEQLAQIPPGAGS